MQKKCSKCKQVKAVEDFGEIKTKAKIYKRSHCNACRCGYQKQYALKNKEKVWLYNKGHYKQNRELVIQKSREYYYTNIDKIKIKAKQYKRKNKEKILLYKKEYSIENKNGIREYFKKYHLKNKEEILLKCKIYREVNKVKIKKFYKDGVINLEDWYIKRLITGRSSLCAADIPQELVEAKRQEMKIKRIIKGE